MNQPLLQALNFDYLQNQYNKLFIQLRKNRRFVYLFQLSEDSSYSGNDVSNNYYSENNEVFFKQQIYYNIVNKIMYCNLL